MIAKDSIMSLLEKLSASVLRFPATVLCSAAGTVLLILWKSGDGNEGDLIYPGIILSAFLGMLIFTLGQLVGERFNLSGYKRIAVYAVGIFLTGIYYIMLPRFLQSCDVTRYAIIFLSVFMMVLIAPFAGRGMAASRGFQANLWRMTIWFIYAVTAAGIIFMGIAMANLMITLLFDLNKHDFQLYVFFVCGGFIAPLIFIHGFPRKETPDNAERPSGFIRVLVNYVFVPLVTIYVAILAVYFGKTIFTHELPKGMTAYLVLSCSLLGIFVYYLVYGDDGDGRLPLVSVYTRLFFWCMIPMTLLLWIAIIMRLSEYGITERRYIVIMSALWLSAVTGHGLLIKRKNLTTWPMMLALMLFASSFGPWGMFAVSLRSQFSRIMEIGNSHGVIKDGKFVKRKDMLPQNDARNLYSSLRYVLENHGGERIMGLIPEKIRKDNTALAVFDGDHKWRLTVEKIISTEFNLDFNGVYPLETFHEQFYSFTRQFNDREPVPLEGMSYLVPLEFFEDDTIRAGEFILAVDGNAMEVTVSAKNGPDLTLQLTRYAKALAGKYASGWDNASLPNSKLTFRADNGTIKSKIILKSIHFSISETGEARVDTCSADLYVGFVK